MVRKLASIQKIIELKPIEKADRIEMAQILGWKCVVPKGEFKVGELVCFIEIDSVMPEISEFEFLRESKFRIRTRKFKGQISQGLIVSLSVLNNKKFPEDTRENPIYEWEEGQEVTSLLGVIKYEPYIPPNLAGEVKGSFPGFIVKTDETRIQILELLLEKYKGIKCYISEKIDGSSITFYIKDGEFGVCSRNLELKETEKNSIWKLARKYDVENKLKALNKNIAIQGEIVGPGINKNTLKLKDLDIYFFNVFDIDNQTYLDLNEFKSLVENKLKLKIVPIISYDYILENNMDNLIELSKGDSLINKEGSREGIVVRPLKEINDNNFEDLHFARVSFKVVNPLYLLKHEN